MSPRTCLEILFAQPQRSHCAPSSFKQHLVVSPHTCPQILFSLQQRSRHVPSSSRQCLIVMLPCTHSRIDFTQPATSHHYVATNLDVLPPRTYHHHIAISKSSYHHPLTSKSQPINNDNVLLLPPPFKSPQINSNTSALPQLTPSTSNTISMIAKSPHHVQVVVTNTGPRKDTDLPGKKHLIHETIRTDSYSNSIKLSTCILVYP